MKIEIYIRPIEQPVMFPSDRNIRLYYGGQWIDFRDGKIRITKDDSFPKQCACADEHEQGFEPK